MVGNQQNTKTIHFTDVVRTGRFKNNAKCLKKYLFEGMWSFFNK